MQRLHLLFFSLAYFQYLPHFHISFLFTFRTFTKKDFGRHVFGSSEKHATIKDLFVSAHTMGSWSLWKWMSAAALRNVAHQRSRALHTRMKEGGCVSRNDIMEEKKTQNDLHSALGLWHASFLPVYGRRNVYLASMLEWRRRLQHLVWKLYRFVDRCFWRKCYRETEKDKKTGFTWASYRELEDVS